MKHRVQLQAYLLEIPLIAILRGVTPQEIPALADVLLEAGFRLIEVPFGRDDTLDSIAILRETVGEDALVGAGTVTQVDQVEALARLDAPLVVSPHFDPALVHRADQLGLLPIPGVATPTEAWTARTHAAALKYFPADAKGISALRILPDLPPVLAVGGVGLELAPWLRAGARGFGIGGALYRAGDDPREVGERARNFVQAYARARQETA